MIKCSEPDIFGNWNVPSCRKNIAFPLLKFIVWFRYLVRLTSFFPWLGSVRTCKGQDKCVFTKPIWMDFEDVKSLCDPLRWSHTHILEMCFLFRFGFLLCAPLALLNYANGLQPKSIKRLPSEFRQRRMLLWWAAKPCPYNLYASTYMPLHV